MNIWITDTQMRPNWHGKELRCKCGECQGFVNAEALDALQRLRELHGKPLGLTSAYRCPAYNRKVGGARQSQHMLGQAFDIPWPSRSITRRTQFVEIAREVGFRGFGYYASFVHIDTRARGTTWGKLE